MPIIRVVRQLKNPNLAAGENGQFAVVSNPNCPGFGTVVHLATLSEQTQRERIAAATRLACERITVLPDLSCCFSKTPIEGIHRDNPGALSAHKVSGRSLNCSSLPGWFHIGYRLNAGQLQCQVDFGCLSDLGRQTTTILWATHLDNFSSRLLAAVLHLATGHGRFDRLHAFASAAPVLFRHAVQTLPQATGNGVLRPGAITCPQAAEHRFDHLYAAVDAAVDAFDRNPGALRFVAVGAEAGPYVVGALAALQGLWFSVGRYFEQVLLPLLPQADTGPLYGFLQQSRRELDALARRTKNTSPYVETLAIRDPEPNDISLDLQASLTGPSP